MKKILLFMLAGSILSNEVAAMQVAKPLTKKQEEKKERRALQTKFVGGLFVAGMAANAFGGKRSVGKLVEMVEEVANAGDEDIVDTLVDKAAGELVGRLVAKVALPTEADIQAKKEELKEAETALNKAQQFSKKDNVRIKSLKAEKFELERELLNMRLVFAQDQLEKTEAAQEVAPRDDEDSDSEDDEAKNPEIIKLEQKVDAIKDEIDAFNADHPELARKTDKENKERENLKNIGTSKAKKAFQKAFRGDGSAEHKENFSKMFTGNFKKVLKMVMNLFDFIFG